MAKITAVQGREILDSRGNPTVEVMVTLENGISAVAGVPSGASTGKHEALELRDGDAARYGGKGVLTAVNNVNTVLAEVVVGMEAGEQEAVDRAMLAADGTENKSKLGANAILGVSLAVARAAALSEKTPLYRYLRTISGFNVGAGHLPIPMFNVLNGGQHSDSGLAVQEFKLVPQGIAPYAEQLRAGSEIFHALKKILEKDGQATGVGDEGGFAPHLKSHARAFEVIIEAIEAAGYVPGKDVFLGIDVAASSFYDEKENVYRLDPEGVILSREQIINLYSEWITKYHLISIEDGLQEEDWEGWKALNEKLGDKVMLIGDDLLVTNTKRLARAIEEQACNAVLIKVNQIGSLTETIECIALAKKNGYKAVISHRSGETTDDFIADLAAGVGAEYIKTGSLSRGERLAKYNRLLAIGTADKSY